MAAATAEVTPSMSWPRRHLTGIVIAALAAALVGMVALAAAQYAEARGQAADDEARADASRVAGQVVTSLTSISAATAPQDIDRLLADTTGQLRDQYRQQAPLLARTVADSHVSSRGAVVRTGVSQSDAAGAAVLVAATATVHNAEAPSGQQRNYRMRVDLQREGDRWLASKLELVP